MSDLLESPPEVSPPTLEAHQERKRFMKDLLETIFLAVVLFLVINAISARVRVDGYSMLPTLNNGEYVLVSRLAYLFGEPQHGDIIVFRPPMYPTENTFIRLVGFPGFNNYEDYIKRVIGLPGDAVKVGNGLVYINDVPLEETYIAAAPEYTGSWVVPEGSLFVLGDNRNNSSDSHSWGLLPIENVLGKAVLVYWPVSNWMVLRLDQAALAAP